MSGNAHAYNHNVKSPSVEEGNITEKEEEQVMSEDTFDDDFLVDVPDIPMPEANAGLVAEVIQDKFYKSEENQIGRAHV